MFADTSVLILFLCAISGFLFTMNVNGIAVDEEESHRENLLRLIESLHENSFTSVQLRVNQFLRNESGCQAAFVFTISDDQHELCCTVMKDKILEERLLLAIQSNSFRNAVRDRRLLFKEDIKADDVSAIASCLECDVTSLLCVPVPKPNSENVCFIVCLLNKEDFGDDDAQLVRRTFRCVAPIFLRVREFEEEKRLREECQSLLTVAKNLFTHLDDVTLLLREIMAQARHLTKAERCSLFLLDKERNELVAKVFDGCVTEDGSEQSSVEVRIPADSGIAGYVATSGDLLNIHDAYAHPLFYRKMDETTGFKTRNILCFPIKDDKGVIGVAELCNKINERVFSNFDEEIAKAFSIYCGISIMHSLMWKKVRDAQHRSRLSNELMMYHMQVQPEDVIKLAEDPITPLQDVDEDFQKFCFIPRNLKETLTSVAVISMFEDMGMIKKWRIPMITLAKFVLMVKKGYRDPPYHNWMHAFSVGHFSYLMHKMVGLMGNYLTELESLALFIACLCHDLDHRGTNNNFQVASKSDLAALYCSEGSVMERHHFAQAMAILNTDGCNILENLSRKEYTQCLDCIRDVILATDLAHHLRIVEDIETMAKDGYDYGNQHHHQLLLCLLITCCDLSDQTKTWKSSKKIAQWKNEDVNTASRRILASKLESIRKHRHLIEDVERHSLDKVISKVILPDLGSYWCYSIEISSILEAFLVQNLVTKLLMESELIYSEFFCQGDLEKAMGVRPSEMMDREKACIPELQIGFIENIVQPVYRILTTLFPGIKETYHAVESNRIFWERMRDVYKRRYSHSTSSLDMFEDESLEQEVLALSGESEE